MQAPRGFSDPFDAWGARRLMLSMEPGRYRGRLVVFRTAGSMVMWRGPDLGWSRWTARPPELVDVPGDHATMLSEGEVADLAAALADTLRSLDRT